MVGGVNEQMVVDFFATYRRQYRQEYNILDDDDNWKINRRCSYTREHKLAAIDYAINTWERHPRTNQLDHISKYYAAKMLKIHHTLLTRWIKKKRKILAQKRGARRLQLTKVGRLPELEKKLNQEFEEAREIGRQISHNWFTR